MDIKKMGGFLKQLRKEKDLTQEQLAQMLNVAGRTVSRWENGNNLPDLDILIALSDFYDVDVREIIDGERKAKEDVAEQNKNIQAIAEYSKEKEVRYLGLIIGIVISGIIAWSISLGASIVFLPDIVGGVLALALIVCEFIFYSICILLNKSSRSLHGYLTALIGGFSAVILSNILLIIVFFHTGEYYNYGIIAAYYALGIVTASFLSIGTIVILINKKRLKK